MSNKNDQSTPVPTPHDDENNRNQSTEAPEGSKPKVNFLLIAVILIIALLIIAAFAGAFR